MVNYFSHDSNARNSDKIIPLRMKMSAEGYGIYFMLLERLREEPDYTSVKDYNMLAFDLRVDSAKVKAVIENFGLFSFTDDGERFYSEGFLERMKQKDEKSEKARQSAAKRWDGVKSKCELDANAMRTHENSDAIKEKKSKGKRNIKTLLTESENDSTSPDFTSGIVKPKKKIIDLSFVPAACQGLMQDWVSYREEIKRPYRSQQSVELFLKQLGDLSGGDVGVARKIIDQSIANGWQGVFELKQKSNGTKTVRSTGPASDEQLMQNIAAGVERGLQERKERELRDQCI